MDKQAVIAIVLSRCWKLPKQVIAYVGDHTTEFLTDFPTSPIVEILSYMPFFVGFTGQIKTVIGKDFFCDWAAIRGYVSFWEDSAEDVWGVDDS